MNDVLKKVSDTVTNEPVIITVDFKPQGFIDRLLIYLRFMKPVRVFKISQIVTGNLSRISKLLTSIDKNIYNPKENSNILESSYEAMGKYGKSLATIVAIAIHNKKEMPPDSLIEFIETHFTAADLLAVVSVVIKQMDVTSFMTTIISVKGINILESQNVNVSSVNGAEVSH